jgi:hypothetical protein
MVLRNLWKKLLGRWGKLPGFGYFPGKSARLDFFAREMKKSLVFEKQCERVPL